MVHSISILGSTGSIGRQTVAVAEHLGLNVRALTTNRNIQLAEEQARRLHPAFVAVTDEASAKALRIALADTDIAVGGGEYALCEAAVISDTDAVVTAVSGAVGLRPTLAAIEKGRRIALANKETLVCEALPGLYPCGEGAGYAGGIMTAAVDGVRCAAELMKRYKPCE